MSEPVTIKRGTEIELEIESLAYGGMGLARIENFVIFVKHAIPGQKCWLESIRKGKVMLRRRFWRPWLNPLMP